jgi:hypothetical protein
MGFMDQLKKTATTVAGEVKDAASTVGSEAGKAGRVAQAQMKLKSLQGDVGEAEKELGQATFAQLESGQLQAPGLETQIGKVREAKAAVAAKEAEIAAIKAEGESAASAEAPVAGAAPTEAAPAAPAAAAPAAETPPPEGGSTQMPGT